MNLQEVLAKLKELNPSADEFAALLKQEAQPLFQAIFNRGHAVATAQAEQDKADLTAQLNTATQAVQAKERELEELRARNPDVAKVREEYEAKVAELSTALETAKREGRAAVVEVLHSRALSDLRAKAAARGVDPDYADVLIQRHGVAQRLQVRDDNRIDLLEEGKTIPVQTDDPLGYLADWMYEQTPANFRTSNADSGSGTRSGGGDGARGFYDSIRDATKRAQGADRPRSAADRLSGAGL